MFTAPVLWKGANCHCLLNWLMCSESFNYWSWTIRKKMVTPYSRISTIGEWCHNVTAFIVCYMEPPSCVCCKTDVLWVVRFLQNRGDIKCWIIFGTWPYQRRITRSTRGSMGQRVYIYIYIYIYTHTHTYIHTHRRTPVSADSVSTVYRGPKKFGKFKK